MNILVDIGHTPQLNFYKSLILQLAAKGNHVYVAVLKRGRLPRILGVWVYSIFDKLLSLSVL